MNLGAEIAQALPEMQRMALSRMMSRVTVRRKIGRTTDADDMPVDDWQSTPDIPCRIGGSKDSQSSRTVTRGGITYEAATRTAHLPVWVDLEDDDLLEVTEGEQVGAVLRVIEAESADQQPTLKVSVVEASRPKEW